MLKKILIAMSCYMVACGDANGTFVETQKQHTETYMRIIHEEVPYKKVIEQLGRAIVQNFKETVHCESKTPSALALVKYILDEGVSTLKITSNLEARPYFNEFLTSPFRIFEFAEPENTNYRWDSFPDAIQDEVYNKAYQYSTKLLETNV